MSFLEPFLLIANEKKNHVLIKFCNLVVIMRSKVPSEQVLKVGDKFELALKNILKRNQDEAV